MSLWLAKEKFIEPTSFHSLLTMAIDTQLVMVRASTFDQRENFDANGAIHSDEPLANLGEPRRPTADGVHDGDWDSLFKDARREGDSDESDWQELQRASALLKAGNLVAIPTETVYGLAANALDPLAVQKIFDAKDRPSDNPLIVHFASLAQLERICGPLPAIYRPVVDAFWPGPLTILLPKPACIPAIVCGGVDTVAVRIPAHPIARALISLSDCPLAAPSANRSGRPSPTCAMHVMHDLAGRIPMVLGDADEYSVSRFDNDVVSVRNGTCRVGVESTVLDALQSPPVILRPGGVTYEDICVLPGFSQTRIHRQAHDASSLDLVPSTPGMKYRHYAPDDASVVLIEHGCGVDVMEQDISHQVELGRRKFAWIHLVDALAPFALQAHGKDGTTRHIRDGFELIGYAVTGDASNLARHLFSAFRHFDKDDCVDVIYINGVSESGVGVAVMNRIRKAASRTLSEESIYSLT